MKRPSAVPEGALWCAEDSEWVFGPKNENGEYHGEVHYWRPDGTLCSIATLDDGKPSGECRRFHENGAVSQIANYVDGELDGLRTWFACDEPTTEKMHAPGMSSDIRRIEVRYDRGRPTAFGFFLADGTEVQRDGAAMIARPESVPESAIYNSAGRFWMAGVWNAAGQKDGEMRLFREDGTPMSIETCRADQLHGPFTQFYEDGTVRARRVYAGGEIAGAFEQRYRSGQLARRGEIAGGAWAGPLEDFDRDGERVRSVRIEPPAPPGPIARPTDGERSLLDRLGDGALITRPLSPAAVASLIAIGWGGDADRDAARAREARRVIKSLAADDEALGSRLAAVGLDRAPRLVTGDRLERLRDALADVDSVDSGALDAALASSGGVGALAAVAAGGGRALEFLRGRIRGERRVDLQWLGLRRLPIELRHLADLVEIEAGHNRLDTVPAEIADLAMLRTLRLSSNRVEALPAELARLRDLASLHLADNQMAQLPPVVLELEDLEVLNLSDNRLETLPAAIGELGRLDHLWISGNPLATLPDSFARLRTLRFVHFGDHPWAEPPPCLWELEELEELWLASRSLVRIPPDIARLKRLRRLHLWYSSLESIPDELYGMTHLRELRIRDNPLPDGTIDRLREALPGCTIY